MSERFSPALLLVAVGLLAAPMAIPDPLHLGVDVACAALALAAALGVLLTSGRRAPLRTPIDWSIAGYLILVLCSALFGVNRLESLRAGVALAAQFGLFYAAAVAARRASIVGHVLLVLLIGAALVEIAALTYHAEMGFDMRPTAYPIPSGWSGYPELGALAALQFGALTGVVLGASRVTDLAGVGLLAAVSLLELVLLFSRTTWVAAGVTVAVAVAINPRHRLRVAGAAALVLAMALAGAFSLPAVRSIARSFVSAQAVAGNPTLPLATPAMRMSLWEKTLRMIRDSPLLGVGPGNFRRVFETKYNPEINNDGRRGVHAHNLWLQQTAELGIPGGLAFLAVWVLGLRTAWHAVRRHRTAAAYAVFLALLGATISNMADVVPSEVAGTRVYLLTWVLFGCAAGLAAAPGTSRLTAPAE